MLPKEKAPAAARGAAPAAGGAAPGGILVPSRARARGRPPKPIDAERPRKIVRVDSLVPYARNARTHSTAQIDKLCRLIEEFGWTNPILVAGNDILAGHARHQAAIKLGRETVPVIDLSHLTKAQRRAYILADNRSALDAGWDDDLLTLELGELRDEGFDLELTGFEGHELDGLLDPGPAAAPAGAGTGITKSAKCPKCGHEFVL